MIVLMTEYLDLGEYREAARRNRIARPSRCVRCGHGRVWFNGWYRRWANLQGEGASRVRERIRVRRCKCAACGGGWSLLPGLCHPHRQFGLETVAATLERCCVHRTDSLESMRGPEGLGPSERTIRRWMRWVPGLVRERILDRLPQGYLPSSRATVAAALRYAGEWREPGRVGDSVPLRALAHRAWAAGSATDSGCEILSPTVAG